MSERGFAPLLIIAVVFVIFTISGFVYYQFSPTISVTPSNIPINTPGSPPPFDSQKIPMPPAINNPPPSPATQNTRYTLIRKTGNAEDKLITFEDKYNSGFYNNHQLTRWNGFLFYVNEIQAAQDPKTQQLISYNIETGEKKIVYSTDSFKSISDKFFSPSGYASGYYFFLNFRIIGDALYFSVKTEGYDGSYPGPGALFILNLPVNSQTPVKITDKSGEIIHAYDRYWLVNKVSPGAECSGEIDLSLFNVSNNNVTPLVNQAEECGQKEGVVRSEIIGVDKKNRLLIQKSVVSYENNNQKEIESIDLSEPTKREILISSSNMPNETEDASFTFDREKLLLVGQKAFFFFDVNSQSLTKIVDFNRWQGDIFGDGKGADGRPIRIGAINASSAYIPIGGVGGVTPSCTLFTFSPPTLKIYNKMNSYSEDQVIKNCYENYKTIYSYNPIKEDLIKQDTDITKIIMNLKLPPEYSMSKN